MANREHKALKSILSSNARSKIKIRILSSAIDTKPESQVRWNITSLKPYCFACDLSVPRATATWYFFHHTHILKGNFGYCPRASFLRREKGKVVWVPSFDHFQIRINTGFRYVYVWWMFPHFLDKKVTKMCPKYLLIRYYKWSSQYQTLLKK